MHPLNVIVHGFDGGMGTQTLAKALEGMTVGHCLVLTRKEEEAAKIRAQSYEFHGPLSLDDVDWNIIAPIDEALIERMRPCEAMVLEMFTRRETDGRVLSYAQRKRTYLQHLRYWNHLLAEKAIDLFLSYNIPHFPREYVLYCLCRLRDIPVILCDPAHPLRDTTLLLDDWEQPAPGLRERFALLRSRGHEGTTPPELPERFEEYFQSQRGEKSVEERVPWYCRTKIFLKPPWSRSPLHWSFYERQVRHVSRVWHARRAFRFYDAHATTPDLAACFIYVPLHMQPECSTCPLAGAYVQQELIVQMLGALVPDDVLIYVKEHPFQEQYRSDGMCRNTAFYRDLLAVRNVRLIPRTFNTYALMEHSLAVAVATGTTGFEALFQEKPVLMFGHRFQQHAPGVFPIRTVDDCSRALHVLLQEGAQPTLHDLRLFLRALGDIAIHGYAEPDFRPSTKLSDDENAERIGGGLQEKIREHLLFPSRR